jgi:hypothetical protein
VSSDAARHRFCHILDTIREGQNGAPIVKLLVSHIRETLEIGDPEYSATFLNASGKSGT